MRRVVFLSLHAGIGLAAAKKLGAAGFTVLAGVRSERSATEVARHPGLQSVMLDVRSDEQIEAAVREAVAVAGGCEHVLRGSRTNAEPCR